MHSSWDIVCQPNSQENASSIWENNLNQLLIRPCLQHRLILTYGSILVFP